MNQYIVNYSIRYVDGPLKGRLYHRHEFFASWDDANAFAGRDGLHFDNSTGAYRHEDSTLTAVQSC